MTTSDTPLSPDTLQAWVDRQLDAEAAARVAAAIADDQVQTATVAAWVMQRDALHTAFDPVLDEPIPARLLAAARPRRRPWAALSAAAAAGLVAGVLAGYALPRPAPQPDPLAALPRAAAIAHALYAPEVKHPVEVGADQQAHLVAWLSKRLDRPIHAPDLSGRGFQLVGGRLLPGSDGGAVAQLMYQDDAGLRLTLYVRRNAATTETAFRFATEDGVSVFYWVDHGMGYALSAAAPRARLLEIAEQVYRQFQGDGPPG
ncbi:anti-sigma factor [Niveibacterium umoris]|uniref:Anti-sigma factor RsiW n=1 Tax=Niveibacterium umoris TaxID=1193620 RepID=A0A840BUV8_9RHOO|nr:anti-sigma factor [Niveibacterium umoris]MBB4014586.1 anti-sigma factor RsiW [Niveibacterium umoris]